MTAPKIVALPAPYKVMAPGLYSMPADAYHGDPCPDASLNSSTAKLIVSRSLAHAREQHPRLNPDYKAVTADHFDLGTAAHRLFTGAGKDIAVVPARDWRSAEARGQREAARTLGRTPLLIEQYDRVLAMLGKLPEHLTVLGSAGAGHPGGSVPEVVGAILDGTVWLRTMIDRLAHDYRNILDYKTLSESAAPGNLDRLMINFGWDVQAAFQETVLDAIDPDNAGRRSFTFLVQETSPPHAWVEARMTGDAMTIGRKKVAYALSKWRLAMQSGQWPAYETNTLLRVPAWAEASWLARELEEQL